MNVDNKEQLQVVETDDSCRHDVAKIAALNSNTDGFSSTERLSGDWFGELKEVDLADLKKEPDDVCLILYYTFIGSCCMQHRYRLLLQILHAAWFVCLCVLCVQKWLKLSTCHLGQTHVG